MGDNLDVPSLGTREFQPTLQSRCILDFAQAGPSIHMETNDMKKMFLIAGFLLFLTITNAGHASNASVEADKKAIAALDTEYQAAVKNNNAATMDRILADDFILIVGSGKSYTKADLLAEARSGAYKFEHQDDSEQTVRVWGDTAVITAKLWEKGTESGSAFDRKLWFSDTYVRTPNGWKYVFGQASLPLSKTH